MIEPYAWSAVGQFENRAADLGVLEDWWAGDSRDPMSVYGRRRVGKSWLFRRFAHGKPAIILVAQEDALPARTLGAFAEALTPAFGVRPQIGDVGELLRVLYRLAADRRLLVVIDEFPYLLGTTAAARRRALTAVQAAIEENRDDSKLKLVIAGSLIAQMEQLQAPRSPLYGRLRSLEVLPLAFPDARALMDSTEPLTQLTTFAVAGGMPRYLSDLGSGRLEDAVVRHVLDRRGGLFQEPTAMLQSELRAPATYFAVLEALAVRPRKVSDLADRVGVPSGDLSPYLETLAAMRMVAMSGPAGARSGSRNHRWACTDNFVRFWFRFARPYQSELEAGADPRGYYRRAVAPLLADHTAPVFEQEVARWVRATYSDRVLRVGPWWGPALHSLRRTRERLTEEIDVVGLDGVRVAVLAEAKWTNAKLDAAVLRELLDYKLPALAQAGFDTAQTEVVLASRSGFTKAARTLAADQRHRIRLVEAAEILSG